MSADVSGLPDGKCFPFLRITPRAPKPRERGLTIAADQAVGLTHQRDKLEIAADYIDVAKLASGFPRLMNEGLVRQKLALYRDYDIRAFFAGEVSELAIMQGSAGRYYEAIAALGGWGVEVSSAQIALDIADKVALVQLARASGLEVVAECGRKGGAAWAECGSLVAKEVERCLTAGAWRVLIQAEGLNEAVEEINEVRILELVAQFGLENLIFQAKEPHLPRWFVSRFGPHVNLDVDFDEVLELESQRRGIRKKGVFGLVAGA